METEDIIIEQISAQKLLPLFYHADADTCLEVARALYQGGIRSLEFTNRGAAALANFKRLVQWKKLSAPDMLLGAGTIRTAAQATEFMEAGADFLVSPVFDAAVCDAAYMQKTLWIPGCMTPTEIHTAESAGCRVIKLFPGQVLTPAFVSAIRELFPGLRFLVTGGVEPEEKNLKAWLSSGAAAVGLGSRLISAELLQSKNYDALRQKTAALLQLLR